MPPEPFQVYRKFASYLYAKYPKDMQRGVAVIPISSFKQEAGGWLRSDGASWFNELGTMQFLMLAYPEGSKVLIRNPNNRFF